MNDIKPLISVIIPVFNREKYLSDAIQSVLDQTYENWELIIVDDGSVDDSIEIGKEWASKDERIQFFQREREPKGAPTARNIGLAHAKGTYLQFLDSDDMLLPDKFERQLDLIIKTGGQVDIIHGAYLKLAEEISEVKVQQCENKWLQFFFGLGITSSNLFSKKMLDEVGGWDETKKSSQEPDLMFRMYKKGAHAICDQVPSAKIQVLSDGITKSNKGANYIRFAEFMFEVYDYVISHALLSKMELFVVDQKIFHIIRHLFRVDEKLGERAFNKFCEQGQITPSFNWNISKIYLAMYKALGFKNTEKIYLSLGK